MSGWRRLFGKGDSEAGESRAPKAQGAAGFVAQALQGVATDATVEIHELAEVLATLIQGKGALQKAGLDAGVARERVSRGLDFECPRCSMGLTGEVDRYGKGIEAGDDAPAYRLDRGLCPNSRCSSRDLQLDWHPET